MDVFQMELLAQLAVDGLDALPPVHLLVDHHWGELGPLVPARHRDQGNSRLGLQGGGYGRAAVGLVPQRHQIPVGGQQAGPDGEVMGFHGGQHEVQSDAPKVTSRCSL